MKAKPMFEGFLHVYAEVAGYAQALDVARELVLHTQQHVSINKIQVEPYWKIPEYYGVILFFEAEEAPKFDVLLNGLASGWNPIHKYADTHWAIWNPSNTSGFVNHYVRWANLEVYPKAEEPNQPVEQS